MRDSRRPDDDRPPLLEVRHLSVRYDGGAGSPPVVAVADLDLRIAAGEALGVLGESGCGKTSLALAVTGLLPKTARCEGAIAFDGERIDDLDERGWRRRRGAEIGFVFQQPSIALHPLRRAGEQIADVLASHRPWPRRRCRQRAAELLAEVDLPADTLRAFPHQLSGGQRQRVVLCQALACRPRLLVADEPTSALDLATRRGLLSLVGRLRRRHRLAMLWISHDPEVLAVVCDRVLVMYAGRAMEEGSADEVLLQPGHPYSRGLLACRPPPEGAVASADRRLPCIPGSPPTAAETFPGCPFAPRCDRQLAECSTAPPPPHPKVGGRKVWCLLPDHREGAGGSRGGTSRG